MVVINSVEPIIIERNLDELLLAKLRRELEERKKEEERKYDN